MAKSSTSIRPGEKRNPSGRPPLTESEKKARELLSTATPHAVQRLIREILDDGPMAVKCAMFVIEHRLGKAPAAEEDREAIAGTARPTWLDELSPETKAALIRANNLKE